jgi:hypothetical protein
VFLVVQMPTSKNLMGAVVSATFVVALTVCLLSIKDKMEFELLLIFYKMY